MSWVLETAQQSTSEVPGENKNGEVYSLSPSYPLVTVYQV